MTQTEVWTIGRLLEWTTDYLRKHGSESPRLDAEVLLSHVRACPRIQLYTSFSEEASEHDRAAFRELVLRRSQGTPVAYLVGHREFYSLSFFVSPDVLIPRSETEHLVVEALDCLKRLRAERPSSVPWRIADVGTGSGCIATALARHAPDCRVVAIDISAAALEVARRNIEKHQVSDRVELQLSNLMDDLAVDQRFDLIVSNPPYVSTTEYEQLAKSVREFEPKLALEAGPDGLDVIEQLLQSGVDRLEEGGWLLMEISPMLAPRIHRRLEGDRCWKLDRIAKDLAGHPRVVVIQKVGVRQDDLATPSQESEVTW